MTDADREWRYWESVRLSNNPADFKSYLSKFPHGEYSQLARNRLTHNHRAGGTAPIADRIVDTVCKVARITDERIRSRQRAVVASLPRGVAMYLMREMTALSLPQISARLGQKDPSTTLRACLRIGRRLDEKDAETISLVASVRTALRQAA